MSFKDHFSQLANEYAKYRPHYSAALFEYLAALAPARETAWDCATGNGQAALGLAPYFARILATDASAQQITRAVPHERIEYRVAVAEHTDIGSHSVDLITVAQALHWFRFDEFYAEVNRVLRPGGVIAVWSYDLLRCDPEIDRLLDEFYYRLIGPFWPPERKFVEERYRTIPFPYPEIAPPDFFMETEWLLEDLIGYLRTWSATQRFIAQQKFDPLPDLRGKLAKIWGEPAQRKHMQWPLHLGVGRLSAA
ncbi:MAG: class I SAM-dependent methyltransferase [bacterium]